jgi:hypothetical protein
VLNRYSIKNLVLFLVVSGALAISPVIVTQGQVYAQGIVKGEGKQAQKVLAGETTGAVNDASVNDRTAGDGGNDSTNNNISPETNATSKAEQNMTPIEKNELAMSREMQNLNTTENADDKIAVMFGELEKRGKVPLKTTQAIKSLLSDNAEESKKGLVKLCNIESTVKSFNVGAIDCSVLEGLEGSEAKAVTLILTTIVKEMSNERVIGAKNMGN